MHRMQCVKKTLINSRSIAGLFGLLGHSNTGERMTAKDDMLQLAWIFMGLGIGAWIIHEIKDTAFQNGYWKGRAHGWDSHRRLMNTKTKSDEVFDYDKN